MRLIDANALKEALKSGCENCPDANTNWCEHCCKINDFEDLIDNAPTVDRFIVTTIPVTLSDGWGHVREAYYDASRHLVFTEAITKELLIIRGIKITEQTEQLRNMRGGEDS